ncbi:MAG: peptide deformylase [Patescibacteria group bacterium]|nr:peptide deformylase [Patescibacteria group bacterium]
MVRKVTEAGHPLLKKKNKPVKNVKTSIIKKLIKGLTDTMYKTGLIGIAAPQIAENYMVFITHPRNTRSRKLIRTDKLRVYVNPRIIFKSKIQSIIYEGCGSLGDVFGPVSRPKEVEVEALDENGKKFRLRANGILARVIQHEYDHLMGVEFIERVDDYKKIVVEKYYRKNIRLSKIQVENSKTTKIEYFS